jgi:tRNA threonylcarbamoyl adenosine modification protein YeaZ
MTALCYFAPMRVLAIDTALEACSVALLDTAQPDRAVLESQPMTRGHAEALMPMIARVFNRAAVDANQIDRVAVTVGPGSFTGLRVGIAAARGIALAAGKPAVGLTTLASYAAPLIAENDAVPVVVAIDARHGHVYLQVFGAGGLTLVKPAVLHAGEAARLARGGPPQLVGTGAELLACAWPAGERLPVLVSDRRAPDIDWVARLGAAAPVTGAPPKPLYLRAPDAQPQEAAQLGRR